MSTIPVDTNSKVWDSFKNKEQGPYIARIEGEDPTWRVKRQFTRPKWGDGEVEVPKRDGVYEIRDFPMGAKRVRYFQVRAGQARELLEPSLDEVLEAVNATSMDAWHRLATMVAPEDAEVASTIDVLTAIDDAEKELDEIVEGGGTVDAEDARMVLDKIRRVAEQL